MIKGIITGSSRGIGLATTHLLTQNNSCKIIGSSTTGTHPLRKKNLICYPLDLSRRRSIKRFTDQLGEIQIDFLINNAAILLEKWHISAIDMEKLKKTFNVNLFGTIELTERLLSRFTSGAHIINVTSEWGSFSEPHFDAFQPHYKMSKAALNMYTRLLSKRLEHRDITVSSIDPGWTQTDLGGKVAPRLPEDVACDIFDLLNRDVQSGHFWRQGKMRPW